MSIKEASRVTKIGYENAKAIKRSFQLNSNPQYEITKNEVRKESLNLLIPSLRTSMETNVSS